MTWTATRMFVPGETMLASILNTYARDNVNDLYGTTGWTAANFAGGGGGGGPWANVAGLDAQFKRVGPWTVIEGAVSGGGVPSQIFILPAGYRPRPNPPYTGGSAGLIFATAGANALYNELRIFSDGTVYCQTCPTNTFFSVACRFLAEM